MVLIVCHHYAVHGGFGPNATGFNEMALTGNKILLQLLSYGGKLGVNLFVLISGYFLVTTGCRVKKAVKLWADITAFSIALFAILAILGADVGLKVAIKSFLPVLYSVWWFATSYFVIYILSGHINVLIRGLTRKQLDVLIWLLVVICSVFPTFLSAEMASSSLMWFFLLYLISARIRLYPLTKTIFNHSLMLGIGGYALSFLTCIVFDLIGIKISYVAKHATYFAGMERTTMLFCSVFLFIGFKNLNIGNSKAINTIAATTFGIYLIHDHPGVRVLLWGPLFHNAEFAESSFLFVHAFVAIVSTFVVCSAISYLYNITIGRCITRGLDKHYPEFECKIKASANAIIKFCDKLIP